MFNIKDLLKYDDIAVQCHDYPDADALASAYAVFTYLKDNGKRPRIIYSGNAEITKPNLLKMIGLLSIPIEYVKAIPPNNALVMVDCQYGESNAARFDAKEVFQLDHHEDSGNGCPGIVRSALGSCSTLIWDLLKNEGFPFEKHPHLPTALYYGLYTDTSSLEEIAHPLDKDMRDELEFDRAALNTLRFNNLTMDELNIAGLALTRYRTDEENGFAVFHAEACDQNILGFISDLALQVENVDVCIVYNTLPNGYKLSIRSCTREVMANEFAAFLASGGGHKQKAGGFIPHAATGDASINEYIWNRTREYFSSYDTVMADNHGLNTSAMPRYKKLAIPVGCVLSTDIFAPGTPMLIRTLEGDSDVAASEGIFLMIGIEGEVYPIKEETFAKSYAPADNIFKGEYTYSPTVKNKITGETVPLEAFARPCVPTGQSHIHAAPIAKCTKVFTPWTPDGYMFGRPGDYIAVRVDSPGDVYIIKKEIFERTYAAMSNP